MPDKLTDNEIVKVCGDVCTDNRFELIEKYKQKLIEGTNIETAKDEISVLDNILFRLWQMGWLDKLEMCDRLQAENKRLTTLAELGNTRANDYRVMRDRALKAEAEIERLKKEVAYWETETKEARADIDQAVTEAYKEFAERLKKETYILNHSGIDNLLKELVGENDAR